MQMNPTTSANTREENNHSTLTTSPSLMLPTNLLLQVSEQCQFNTAMLSLK